MPSKLSRRQFGRLAVSGAALGLSDILSARQAPAMIRRNRQPNILLIVTDQEQAWSQLPGGLELPARQLLAQRSTHFTQAQVVNPLCSTSRGNLYTGQHGQHTGLWENTPMPWSTGGLVDGVATIGHMFRDLGYTTLYNGKWHLTHIEAGKALRGGLSPEQTRELFYSRGFDLSDQAGEVGGTQGGFVCDPQTAKCAEKFIHQQKGAGKPWFQAVNFVNPHDIMFFAATQAQQNSRLIEPFALAGVPEDEIYRRDHGFPLPANFGPASRKSSIAAHGEHVRSYEGFFGDLPWEDESLWCSYRNYYFNCLRDVDRHINTVLNALERSGQADDTVVMFVSDHGEMGGAHGHRGKGCLVYKECINVPLLVSHPDARNGWGKVNKDVTSHVDIVPTLLALAGLDDQARQQKYPFLKGQNFAGLIERPGSSGPRADSGALYQWSSLAWIDPDFVAGLSKLKDAEGLEEKLNTLLEGEVGLPNLDARGFYRGVFDGRYKFARYFSPLEHHRPTDFDTLTAHNDLELYDTQNDPDENENLASEPENVRDLLLAMNEKLNRLIADEVGEDEGDYMPGPQFFWAL